MPKHHPHYDRLSGMQHPRGIGSQRIAPRFQKVVAARKCVAGVDFSQGLPERALWEALGVVTSRKMVCPMRTAACAEWRRLKRNPMCAIGGRVGLLELELRSRYWARRVRLQETGVVCCNLKGLCSVTGVKLWWLTFTVSLMGLRATWEMHL